MLIALLTILLMGGAQTTLLMHISNTQDNVNLVMPKNDERKAALGVLKQMEKLTGSQNKQTNKYVKQLNKAVADHGHSSSDIDRLWGEFHQQRGNFHTQMIDLRFELKEHISREDWLEIFGEG